MSSDRYLATNFYQEQPSEALSPLPLTPYHARAAERSDVRTVGKPEKVNPSSNRRQSFSAFSVGRGAVAVLTVGMVYVAVYVATHITLSSPWPAIRDAWTNPSLSFRPDMFQRPRPRDGRYHELLTEISSIQSLTSPTAADVDTRGPGVFGRVPNTPCGPDVVFGKTSSPVICDSSSWEFMGTTGQLGILFPHPSRLNTITVQVQHGTTLPKCAPRDLVLWGLVGRQKDLITLRHHHHSLDRAFSALPGAVVFPAHESHQVLVPLAVFRFNAYSENLTQTFTVEPVWDADYKEEAMLGFGVAILQVLTNWGSSLTCIHRLYFHGHGM
ncbi:hypothetical protein GSI_08762 [Ganoderma sinense ZZ0214-1]|uniref:SUN domain-containing protein n=1 Tax=Ganoderma sinense ZZ0214-1 TaxID=1077348 RepID=A0A2G8S597_9APHY|nr:hypothetical protein GSI_08762 [Ganoderma sinense ZZ0214-1]